jgi:hypothetical protein
VAAPAETELAIEIVLRQEFIHHRIRIARPDFGDVARGPVQVLGVAGG